MFRKTTIAAGILASCVAFTTGAFAATAANVAQTSTNNTYAQELFGTGSDAITITPTGTTVVLTVDADVDIGESADFTLTMSGAQFKSSVALSALGFSDNGAGNGAVTITKQSGGTAGSSSIVYRVTVGTQLTSTDAFTFTVPALTSASGLGTLTTGLVNIATTIEQISTSGGNTFPTSVSGTTGTNTAANVLVANSANEVTLAVGAGSAATIDVDARTDVTTNAVAITNGGNTFDGVLVGTVTLTLGGAGQAAVAANAYAMTAGEDGEGDVTVTVAGGLNSTDVVFLDLDTDAVVDSGESLTISGTTATGTFDNEAIRALGALNTYVVVDGVTTLIPANYVLTATTGYDASTALTDTATTTTSTSYSGLTSDGWALAIPASTSVDIANIRVTNETSASNTLFAQCYQQDGTSMGFEEVTSLVANETKVLKSTDLEAVFGTWTGRARCDFSRSGNISVQTLVRSNGTLINMTGTSGIDTGAESASQSNVNVLTTNQTRSNIAR